MNLVVILSLSVAGIYAAYALWDNSRVYTAANDVQADMVKIKPVVEEEGGASFEELLAINPDVCAWVTVDNTNIDLPVLQGSTNLTFLPSRFWFRKTSRGRTCGRSARKW